MNNTNTISALLASCLLFSSITGAPVTTASTHTPSILQRRQAASFDSSSAFDYERTHDGSLDTVSALPEPTQQTAKYRRCLGKKASSQNTLASTPASSQITPTSTLESTNEKCAIFKLPALEASLMDKVKSNLTLYSQDSWVSGTRMQALLEYDTPNMTVYTSNFSDNYWQGRINNAEVDNIASEWLRKLPDNPYAMIIGDTVPGDTASVGVGFINAARKGRPERERFNNAAAQNIEYLLNKLPRDNATGAISHRPPHEPFQAWNDNAYMVPPFLAYWGSLNGNLDVTREAHKQIKAYRTILRDPKLKFWRHVSNNTMWADHEFWGSGMAWATAGMSRVLAPYKHGPFANELKSEMDDLAKWANELLSAVFHQQNAATALLPNTYHQNGTLWFDPASSALFASSVYRLASLGVLDNQAARLTRAGRIREAISGALSRETGWMWAADPLKWYSMTDKSAESMTFVLLMEAAARDYREQIGC